VRSMKTVRAVRIDSLSSRPSLSWIPVFHSTNVVRLVVHSNDGLYFWRGPAAERDSRRRTPTTGRWRTSSEVAEYLESGSLPPRDWSAVCSHKPSEGTDRTEDSGPHQFGRRPNPSTLPGSCDDRGVTSLPAETPRVAGVRHCSRARRVSPRRRRWRVRRGDDGGCSSDDGSSYGVDREGAPGAGRVRRFHRLGGVLHQRNALRCRRGRNVVQLRHGRRRLPDRRLRRVLGDAEDLVGLFVETGVTRADRDHFLVVAAGKRLRLVLRADGRDALALDRAFCAEILHDRLASSRRLSHRSQGTANCWPSRSKYTTTPGSSGWRSE
jgi:hypothetical protein